MRRSFWITAPMAALVAATVAACWGVQPSSPDVPAKSDQRLALLQAPMSPSQLLELQADGRLPGPIPATRAREQLRQLERRRPAFKANKAGTIGLWATDTNFNYLLGQTSDGRTTVTSVNLAPNNCYSPVGVRVDAEQNVWVACELTSPSTTSGALQEYGTSGQYQKQYLPGCPASVKGCTSFDGYGWDSGIDSNGNVFTSLNIYSYESCSPSCNSTLGAGFEWWPKGKNTDKPHLISAGASCSPICGVGFMDIDASNNIWFTFSGYAGTAYGFGLGEVTRPTAKKPIVTIVEPVGTYQFFGGVNVSNAGTTLNVLDQSARTISQYALPLSPSGAPFHTLGPIPQNAFEVGDPVAGGFNKAETKLAYGDTGGWIDIGNVLENKWTAVASPNFYSGLEGAAYTPSDK
jgi:hypothetical protein